MVVSCFRVNNENPTFCYTHASYFKLVITALMYRDAMTLYECNKLVTYSNLRVSKAPPFVEGKKQLLIIHQVHNFGKAVNVSVIDYAPRQWVVK